MAFTATKDLLLPATVTGSWPRPRWYSANLWGRPLDSAMMDPWFREQFTDAHAIVAADQARAGLDILTTGDYHLDEDVAGRSWHHYPLQRWKGLEHEELQTERTRSPNEGSIRTVVLTDNSGGTGMDSSPIVLNDIN